MTATTETIRRGAHGLRADLERQLELMGARVPAYRGILAELIELARDSHREPISGLGRAWQHRRFDSYYERPLLILACLRHDALLEGVDHPLWRAIASDAPDASIVTRETVLEAFSPERLGMWTSLRARRVQTNEVTRAVTWLWPAALAGAREQRPLVLVDIGASAGLNLVGDRLDLTWTDQAGHLLPVSRPARVLKRLGFDSRLVDALLDEDIGWLRACLWSGETERLDAMNAALREFARAEPAVEMERLTASAVPARLATITSTLDPDALLLAYQTLVTGYLTTKERSVYAKGMNEFLSSAPKGRAVWLSLEVEEETEPLSPARLSASVAAGGAIECFALARTSYHPVTLTIDRDEAQRFSETVRP